MRLNSKLLRINEALRIPMATIKTVIKRAKGQPVLNKSGEVHIYLKYTHDQRHILIGTEVKVPPDQWDGEQNQSYPVKGSGRTTKNNLILQARQKLERIIADLNYNGVEPTIEAVKRSYSKPVQESDIFTLFDQYIDHSTATKAKSTVKQLYRWKNNFVEYCSRKRKKPTIESIDLSFYDDFVAYYLKQKNMANSSVGKEVKILKSFLNFLKERGYKVSDDVQRFKVFKEKPLIVYLTQEELDRLFYFDFGKAKRLEKARDLFVLQASTGMRWSDLSRLDKEHIHEDIITMKAYKNKKQIFVPITPKARAILEKYEYQLPKLSEQKLNLYIKEACKVVEIDQPIEKARYQGGKKTFVKVPKYQEISSHVAVKTFITHCGEKGISAKVVSEITGKTVKVILDHYYGTDRKTIVSEIARAFG